ncbi:hypothetical protein RBSH_05313 [Rhodopirellula baltica SH28]|uniref:Uncharacterized protein n=1 Tax=Rhodopirellula baltica SH28 TaxID=993517 RepID=K5CYZ8_RHOBT|nr:hypothetical protein RBSH_05313 [Rhodopirellula baltica SH28]
MSPTWGASFETRMGGLLGEKVSALIISRPGFEKQH